jgi:hypothetical protein
MLSGQGGEGDGSQHLDDGLDGGGAPNKEKSYTKRHVSLFLKASRVKC